MVSPSFFFISSPFATNSLPRIRIFAQHLRKGDRNTWPTMANIVVDDVSAGNKYIVCQQREISGTSFGTWMRQNPLNHAIPLTFLQLSAITLTSSLIDTCLQPLGQSVLVAQIVGGIVLGPSMLGAPAIMGSTLFPARSIMPLETFGCFGILFFLFAIGARADGKLMVQPGKRAIIIGMSSLLITIFSSVSLAELFKSYVRMDEWLASALPIILLPHSLTGFSSVSCLLIELNMVSSNVGHIVTSTALWLEVIGITLLVVTNSFIISKADPNKTMQVISLTAVVLMALLFIVRPIIQRSIKRIPAGKPLDELYVFFCFTTILTLALITEFLGQHYYLGPLLFGFLIPDGPPLGAPIISKLDLPVGKFLYPIYLTTSGLKTNIFKIDLWSLLIIAILAITIVLIRVLSVVLSGYFFNMSFRECILVGLVLNAKGIFELLIYNMCRDSEILTDAGFALCVLSIIGVTAIITPLIKYLYDPSERLITNKRRTIQHSKRDAELRILVCIHNQESTPLFINVLEASKATESSPITVIAVMLEELEDRATRMLAAHQSTRVLQPTKEQSSHITKALHQYELHHETCVKVQSFSAVSHLQTLHEDICRLALNQTITMIILPFHKRWAIDGSIESVNKSLQHMNIKVVDKAPCSVGILVDRGILNGWLSIINSQSIYRVAVIFITGPDDMESLCYGARMAGHTNVTLTIFRYLLLGYDSSRERKQDNILIDEVRHANMENQNFIYQEHVVKDGAGLATSLRSLDSQFDLLIVGKNHPVSKILMGLDTWSECPELGVVGDMLSSSDMRSTTSVLVVQQQRLLRDKMRNARVTDLGDD